jgi:Ner family transcriptional regulator
MPSQSRGWHREDIKAAVRKRGKSLEQLAIDNNLEPRATSSALRRPHSLAELVIAEFLGMSPRELWPQRFGQDGKYLHPNSETYHTRRRRPRECRKGAAE